MSPRPLIRVFAAVFPPPAFFLAAPWLAICLLTAASISSAAGQRVDFQRDVRPILQAHCIACHGERKQESEFRLDRCRDALHGGSNGVAIVPGNSARSPLIDRITGADANLRMPPKGELLSPAAVSVIRAWIDEGAVWPADAKSVPAAKGLYWSLRPLVRPPIPSVADGSNRRNPVDAFVAATLAAHGLSGSAEADRLTLVRRVTIDLTGLPPTSEEAAAFVGDASSDAYDRLVDRLLASPLYGERWARHWMDVVHFAETHGHDQDRPRPNAWPYRDYLIRSFNGDKPYARFVAEQVAGDVLEPDDPQATVALGFLAAGPWDESSLMSIADDTTDKKMAQVLDRDDMVTNVMSTFTSTTVQCARCHNHKFDPITQADYYALQAVFAGVDRADRLYDADPAVQKHRRLLNRCRRDLARPNAAAEMLVGDAGLRAEVARLEEELVRNRAAWKVVRPQTVSTAHGSVANPQADGSILFGGPRPETETCTLTLSGDLDGITAIQLELLTDPALPHGGPGRHDNGNLHLSEVGLSKSAADGKGNERVPIANAYSDFDQADWPVTAAIDGKPETAWGIHPEVGKPHTAVFSLREPLRMANKGPVGAGPPGKAPLTQGRGPLTVTLAQLHGRGHLIGRMRLSVTTATRPEWARPLSAELAEILALPSGRRSAAQKTRLTRTLIDWRLAEDLAALPAPAVVYAACNDFKPEGNFRPAAKPRPVHLLRRGDINQPMQAAVPGAMACVPGIEPRFALDAPENEGSRRAALARWLVDPRNVLTWRSIANRAWHDHFDRGIVDTPNDLGRMGGLPSHPALLDWLAAEFRDRDRDRPAGGGSLKRLHRLIVTSAAYRQSSAIDPARTQVDAENRYLWRQNRRRLDAETIRDAVLQLSGKLDLPMGGPSARQFLQTRGLHVTPNVDYETNDVDAPANFRRSVYRFLFRTLPDPLMESLDCPDGSQFAPVRSQSVTALQALSLLHNRFIVRQSEHAALRLQNSAATLPGRIKLLFRLALLRDPADEESRRWEAYAAKHGLANTCRMMVNTNEFVFVN